IDYVGSADIYIRQQPLHYKYSDKIRHPLQPVQKGHFSRRLSTDSMQLARLHINDQSYPLLLKPGQSLTISLQRADFPDSLGVKGYQEAWNEAYIAYRKQEQPLITEIEQQLPAFRKGESTRVIQLYKQRMTLAKEHFQGTPFAPLYYQTIGEYLVKRLEQIKYQADELGLAAEKKRQAIIKDAKMLNFFTFKVLHAQRAGIRDFTNAYANTFGVADSLEAKVGQDLMQYDVKRLGYETLDSARTSVLQHIEERAAQAYARMFLIAERIGEMPLKVAEPGYRRFLEKYSDFPAYTSFLKTLYDEIKKV